MTAGRGRGALTGLVLSAVAAGGLSLGGCVADPCKDLRATDRDRQATADGYEVERQGARDADCELQPDGSWRVDD